MIDPDEISFDTITQEIFLNKSQDAKYTVYPSDISWNIITTVRKPISRSLTHFKKKCPK
jgi:hypothetical protein